MGYMVNGIGWHGMGWDGIKRTISYLNWMGRDGMKNSEAGWNGMKNSGAGWNGI